TAHGDYTQTNALPTSIPAVSTCIISVTFTPTVTGTRTGSIIITHSAFNSPSTATLSGPGILPVTLSAASLTFSNQVVGSSSAVRSEERRVGQAVPVSS